MDRINKEGAQAAACIVSVFRYAQIADAANGQSKQQDFAIAINLLQLMSYEAFACAFKVVGKPSTL